MAIPGPAFLQIAQEAKRRFAAESDPSSVGLRDWLVAGGTYFVTDSTDNSLVVSTTDDSWSHANGADFARYLWAARDSVLPKSCNVSDPRALAWASITAYYAGLYLVLGLLRLFGYGLLYLTADDCSLLANIPASTPLKHGVYSLRVQFGPRSTVELRKKQASGFHDAFWRYADNCLQVISNEIGAGTGVARPFSPAVRTAGLLEVEELRTHLGKAGAIGRQVGWMSQLRNEVNYRLARSAWSPNFRSDGVRVDRLRQDILGIIRGSRTELGTQLRLDRDIRVLIERVSILFRAVTELADFPAL